MLYSTSIHIVIKHEPNHDAADLLPMSS